MQLAMSWQPVSFFLTPVAVILVTAQEYWKPLAHSYTHAAIQRWSLSGDYSVTLEFGRHANGN